MMFFGYTLHYMQYTTIHIATYLLKKKARRHNKQKNVYCAASINLFTIARVQQYILRAFSFLPSTTQRSTALSNRTNRSSVCLCVAQ